MAHVTLGFLHPSAVKSHPNSSAVAAWPWEVDVKCSLLWSSHLHTNTQKLQRKKHKLDSRVSLHDLIP